MNSPTLKTLLLGIASLLLPVLGGCASSNDGSAPGGGSASLHGDLRPSPQPPLGVIRLDYPYPPILGDVDYQQSFAFPIEYEIIDGLTFEECQEGVLNDELKTKMKAAIARLEAKNVVGIAGDCGFMMFYQSFLREQTDLPVFMSSLIFSPVILPMLNPDDRIAILTANSVNLKPAMPKIFAGLGLEDQLDRFLVVGCQDVPGFEALANGTKVDRDLVGPGIEALAMKTVKDHPEVKVFIYECTELGAYGNRVRASTGRPVFDAVTLLNFFHSSIADNSRLSY